MSYVNGKPEKKLAETNIGDITFSLALQQLLTFFCWTNKWTVSCSAYFIAKLMQTFAKREQAFNPIPAWGGVNLNPPPPCSYCYITQKVLVWDCWNFLTFPKYSSGRNPPFKSKIGLLY